MSLVDLLPVGHEKIYEALRNAGMRTAEARRNVPWLAIADDGVPIMNVWRRMLSDTAGEIVATIDAREWPTPNVIRRRKTDAVVTGLSAWDGQRIRVVILEERTPRSRKTTGARADDAQWLVEDTGEDFLLWRGREPRSKGDPIPVDPVGFAKVDPTRKERVSKQIERDPKVRMFTLKRAGNQCEVTGCKDVTDFLTLDVHHITRLGDGGSDHMDNTVALCPACHARVHRGVDKIRLPLLRALELIRDKRLNKKR